MLKVLFCSPYKSSEDVVKGGINTWGRYIMSYAKDNQDDIQILPISFDRHAIKSSGNSRLSRIYNGMREYRKPIRDAISQMKLESPDLIHLCTSAGFGLFRDILLVKEARRIGIRTVVHFHFGRIPELVSKNNWEWKLLANLIDICDTAIVMNRPTERALLGLGYTNVKYLPNPLGVEVMDEIYDLSRKLDRVQRRLLYAGHVIRTKGVYELVEACSFIPNIELRIVGKCLPDVETDLKDIASKKDGGRWLNIIGEVDHCGVLTEMIQADMFVFPSYTEGFPNVILEAMACGCTIVSSDVGSIPEMLDVDGIPCGLCFRPKSKDDIIDSIMSIIDDAQLRCTLAHNAYKRLNENYTMPRVWGSLINIWKRF